MGVEEVVRAEIVIKGKTVPASELVVEAVEGVQEVLEGLDVLDALELANSCCDIFALHFVDAGCHHRKHIFPGLLSEIGSLPQEGHSKPLSFESVVGLPGLIREPFLVNCFVNARINPHDGIILVVDSYVAAEGVHEIDGVLGEQFVRPGGIGEGTVVERSHGAYICQIAAQLRGKHLLDVRVDLSSPSATRSTQIVIPAHLFRESDAASAVNTPVHVGDHQWTYVLVLDCSLVLVVPTCCESVEVGVVLEVALTALVADGAVKRVVCQQELHDTAACKTSRL